MDDVTDERRLHELLHAATEDAPPAGFDHADVVAAAQRATARRRRIAGVAAGVLGVIAVGSIVAGALTADRDSPGSAAAAPAPAGAPADARDQAAPAPQPAEARRPGCLLDQRLATDLAAALPAARDRPVQAVPGCPVGARGVAVTLPGCAVQVVVGPTESATELPPGAQSRTVRTASGQSLTVSAIPTPAGPGPDPETLAEVSAALAPRY